MAYAERESHTPTEADLLVDIQDHVMMFRVNSSGPSLWEWLTASDLRRSSDAETTENLRSAIIKLLERKGLLLSEALEVAYFTTRELHYLREADRAEQEGKRKKIPPAVSRAKVSRQQFEENKAEDTATDVHYKQLIHKKYSVPENIAKEWLYRMRVESTKLGEALYKSVPERELTPVLDKLVNEVRGTRRHANLKDVDMIEVRHLVEVGIELPQTA